MFKRFLFIALIALLAGGASAQDTVDQTLFMSFIPNIQFAPVYVAIEKGYFAERGIDLSVEHGDEPVGVDLIALDERQFGIISGEQVIAARANARPVVFVYEWFQQYPVGIVVPAESDIQAVADLRGRNVGIPMRSGASYAGLTALLTANGMDEQAIDLEEIGFNAPEVVCVGGVEASVIYLNNEPLQIQHRAEQGECGDVTGVRVFPVAEAADLVSNGLITNEATIAESPDLVRAMAAAFDAGLRDAIRNPAEAYLLSAAHVENLPLPDALRAALEAEAAAQPDAADREALAAYRADLYARLSEAFDADTLLQFEVLLATIDLWDADSLGLTEADSWETTQATLVTMGFIDAPLDDLAAAYTNAFVPQ